MCRVGEEEMSGLTVSLDVVVEAVKGGSRTVVIQVVKGLESLLLLDTD
jgi:hypothetical protein